MEHQFREQYEYELGEYWKAIIKEDVTKGNEINKKFLPPKIRKFIWDISKVLLQDPESIPGSACRIIEQFYAEQVEKYCKCSDFYVKIQLKRKLMMDFPLTVSCAIFIAAKIVCRNARGLDIYFLIFYLATNEIYTTPQLLIRHEFEIMRVLNFKLPLWNGLETALVIAMAASMKELLMEVSYAMDLAEYRASIINEEICKVSGSKSAICTARLSAGVVVAVAEKNALNMDRVLESVSIYSSLTIDYLKLIKDIIVKYI
ncbi:uncharacterized protein LOC123705520 isoform X1 [Colias croceus]|uniref:uncharacterized protein LOC123705520 isoform X1 n=1 Tax=Colias crocea TaxID=72248 RepID=UPI001E27EF36|nr:uncharacterized protein LOC123705520 isoform X1 [Colias croceus]